MRKNGLQKFKKGDAWINISDEKPRSRDRAFKGSKFGAASKCITFSQEERNFWINENQDMLKQLMGNRYGRSAK